ncbi:MAG TPA: asparagine synthase C-terminal domain-containing protein, partial [Longimicrobiales bacterium]|nr:asparagine synthase C-terminal domain-containing protein [Longimicrobiales bacterium]
YRLIADVPLGAFLSGGLDSSAVVAEMSRQMDRPVETFSIGFEEPEFNEAPDAAAVAAALGTRHHELVVTPAVEELIDDIALAFDEPFADSSAVPTLLVSRLAARHVKVVLSGDGGDELFGGYTRYRHFRSRRAWADGTGSVLAALARRSPHALYGRNRLLDLGRDHAARYVGMVADPLDVPEGGVAKRRTAAAVADWGSLLDAPFAEAAGRDPIGQLMHVDLLSYLPGDILTKVDRMSMAASIEARVPLLDHHLVEFACRIPTGLKLRNGSGKWIFREAMRELVPPVVFAKRKQGFGVPLRPWFRGPLRARLEELTSPAAPVQEWVDGAAVRRVLEEHTRGRRDRSPLLWKLLMLNLWLRAQRSRSVPSAAALT